MTSGKKPSAEKSWITSWLYAHRGLHDGKRPENSLAAFKAAMEAGYGIELDVRLSIDGEVMVFHDDDLMRMAGDPGSIETHTAAELAELRLQGTDEHIPRLAEVLQLVDGKVPLLIETKAMKMNSPLHWKVRDILLSYDGKYALQSFSPFAMCWFRRKSPWETRGQLSYTFPPGEDDYPAIAKFFAKHLLGNFLGRPNFISYGCEGLSRPVIRRLRRRGLPILAWTVRSPSEAARVSSMCDTIIFEGFRPAPRAQKV